jgi:hypothetical protein
VLSLAQLQEGVPAAAPTAAAAAAAAATGRSFGSRLARSATGSHGGAGGEASAGGAASPTPSVSDTPFAGSSSSVGMSLSPALHSLGVGGFHGQLAGGSTAAFASMLPAALMPADGVSAAARAGQWRSGVAGGFLSPVPPGGVAAGSSANPSHPSLLALAARLRAQQHPSLQQQHQHGQSQTPPPPLPSL